MSEVKVSTIPGIEKALKNYKAAIFEHTRLTLSVPEVDVDTLAYWYNKFQDACVEVNLRNDLLILEIQEFVRNGCTVEVDDEKIILD